MFSSSYEHKLYVYANSQQLPIKNGAICDDPTEYFCTDLSAPKIMEKKTNIERDLHNNR